MFCPSCGQENPSEARFCAACGTRLEAREGAAVQSPMPTSAAAGTGYAGFWIRFLAWVIDTIIIWIGSAIVGRVFAFGGGFYPGVYFPSFLFSGVIGLVAPVLYYVLLTGIRGQTLGKMALGIKVVNVNGEVPGIGYAALREIIGKFISGIALMLGFLWIAWDAEKQGWHDKIAGTWVRKVR